VQLSPKLGGEVAFNGVNQRKLSTTVQKLIGLPCVASIAKRSQILKACFSPQAHGHYMIELRPRELVAAQLAPVMLVVQDELF
jgi:hypothetical protein